nr:hypothetical protein [uncultured Rhodopila sp.]
MIRWLSRIYRRTGIHAAPRGTLLHWCNHWVQRIVYPLKFRYRNSGGGTPGLFGSVPYYDIKRMRRTRPVSGLALIFHMGAGDYLMATPLIRALRLAHPDLPLYAYASTHGDTVNSPLVLELLKINPLVDRVFAYRGRPRELWTDYDFADALKAIPKDFLILPVIYDVDPGVFHRTTSLFETFDLPIDFPLPTPIAYEAPLSEAAGDLLDMIRQRYDRLAPAGIVCTHFGSRSAGYEYPFISDLVNRLLKQGWLVLSFSPTGVTHDRVIDVDISTITPGDSIELLRALKKASKRLSLISVNSLMWPISAALEIPNLGLHVFRDPALHQYLYPNIFVVTPHFFPTLPAFRLLLAPPGSYGKRQSADGRTDFVDYRPEYVADLFEGMA